MPKNKNKFRRVALEGATVDGRKISRDQIQQMADNYNPKDEYAARIWLEHFRSLYPDSTFNAYGDVLELKAEEVKTGKNKGKLGLYAKLDPADNLLELNKKRQKVFTSIEVDPDFADTGEAYLVGLAVTDSPASRGVEMLKFSLGSDKFSTSDHLYSEPIECDLFTDLEKPEEEPGLFAKVKELFSKKNRNDSQRFNDVDKAVLDIAKETVDLKEKFEQSETAFKQLQDDFNALKEQLENEETPPAEPRKLSGGYNTQHHKSHHTEEGDELKTDC